MNCVSVKKDLRNSVKANHKKGLLSENSQDRNEIIKRAFIKTDEEMNNRSFDITFSGSTAVTIILEGNRLICANVGDSRDRKSTRLNSSHSGESSMTSCG